MKLFKTVSATFLLAVIFLLAAGCRGDIVVPPPIPDPDPDPPTPPVAVVPYDVFSEKFAEGSTGKWSSSGDEFTVTFTEGSLTLDSDKTRVVVCTRLTWPSVTLAGGTWRIDGTDTGIALTSNPDDERIVVVIYDGGGIYVRLSSGGMFYFHNGQVLDVGCFRFEKAFNPSLDADVICNVTGNTITGDLGKIRAYGGIELIPTFGSRGQLGVAGSTRPLLSSFSSLEFSGVSMEFWVSKDGAEQSYTMSLDHGGTIPVLRVNTRGQGAPTSKENYITVDMTIEDPDLIYGTVASETVATEIRGRGNTTWGMPKKPYKIKLEKKKRLLGMSDNRHWTLLANYSDKSLLRNSLAFKIAELSGMSWSPRWVPVELYMDGRYQGQYMLTEQVRTGDERIEMSVAGAGDNSGDAITGGYLFCIDEKDFEGDFPKVGFHHERRANPDWGDRLPVAFDEPEDPTQAQIDYAKKLFADVDDAIYNKSLSELSEVIDIESFIDYYFVHELAKDPDGNMRLSTYLAKPRGGKLYFPCVWDFDITFGNCDYTGFADPAGWQIRGTIWFKQLFRNQEFCDLVKTRWNELRPKMAQLEPLIRAWATEIDDAQKRNFETWKILGVYVWPNYKPETRKTYKAEVDFLIDFLNRRVEWLDREINAGRHKN